MTQPAQVLLMDKLKGQGIILAAARHNLRELPPADHINTRRSPDNVALRGPGAAREVAGLAQSLLDAAGIKSLRVDAVRALELIVSLPPASGIDEHRFFVDTVEWAERFFDGAPILSAVVHQDEAAPHMHMLILPLVAGRMIGSDLMGGFGRLQAIQNNFHDTVAKHYGLVRQTAAQPRQEHARGANRNSAARSALAAIKARYGLVIGPEAEAELLDLITAPKRAKQTFVGIMTKPVKPEKANPRVPALEGQESTKEKGGAIPRTLCSVGFAGSMPPSAPAQTVETVPAVAPAVDTAPAIAASRSRPASPMRVRAIASMRALLARPGHAATVRNSYVRVSGPFQRSGP